MFENIKIAFFDLDGTLTNNNKIISENNLNSLKLLSNLGNLINSLLIEIPTTVILLIFAYLIDVLYADFIRVSFFLISSH